MFCHIRHVCMYMYLYDRLLYAFLYIAKRMFCWLANKLWKWTCFSLTKITHCAIEHPLVTIGKILSASAYFGQQQFPRVTINANASYMLLVADNKHSECFIVYRQVSSNLILRCFLYTKFVDKHFITLLFYISCSILCSYFH